MKHLLLVVLAATVGAAEPTPPAPRDPFAPVPVEGAAATLGAAPAPAPMPSRPPSLDAIGRSGQTAIAVFSVGTRRVAVAVGSEFTIDQEALTFVSCQGEEVLLRNRAGKETRLQVITPTGMAAPKRIETPAAGDAPAEP